MERHIVIDSAVFPVRSYLDAIDHKRLHRSHGTIAIDFDVFLPELKIDIADPGRYLEFRITRSPETGRWMSQSCVFPYFHSWSVLSTERLMASLNALRVPNRNFDPIWSFRPSNPTWPKRGQDLVVDIVFVCSQFPETVAKLARDFNVLCHVISEHFPAIAAAAHPRVPIASFAA